MKVYIIETHSLDSDFNLTSIEKVFSTFRGASEYLIDEAFEPFYFCFLGKCDIRFYFHDEENILSQNARIIEMEVEENEKS